MENELKQENLEVTKEEVSVIDTLKTQVDELSLKLKDVTELQSKMVDVIKKTNEMQIKAPVAQYEKLTDSEKYVTDVINEFRANPTLKWKYPAESKKLDIVFTYLVDQQDIKQLGKRYE